MTPVPLARPGETLKLLCIGAHSDDIEIGAGATILGWIEAGVRLEVHWLVLSALGPREAEARRSAEAFLSGAALSTIETETFRDGYFPADRVTLKERFEVLRQVVEPDLVLTHHHDDAHQDHRLTAELTRNTFRNHLTLAYEIPKWDGDLGRPNVYVAAAKPVVERKIALLMEHFATQRSKDWFDADTFMGLMRLRGMECRAQSRFAEAFHNGKMLVA